CLHASPAQAILQAFVSGNGSDGNNCTRTFPCRSFQAAHDAVNAGGGFINCLDVFDSSTNATFNISKSVTIDCTGVFAKILGPGGTLNAVTTNGPSLIVTLRGLSIEGAGAAGIGIDVQNAGLVRVEQCKIFGFMGGNAIGIRLATPAAVAAKLHVSDSVIVSNGSGTTGAAIVIAPQGAGRASVTLGQ